MTRRRQRFLQQRPAKIARKRLKRRRLLARRGEASRVSIKTLRKMLEKYVSTQPARKPIRARKTLGERIKGVFKPSV